MKKFLAMLVVLAMTVSVLPVFAVGEYEVDVYDGAAIDDGGRSGTLVPEATVPTGYETETDYETNADGETETDYETDADGETEFVWEQPAVTEVAPSYIGIDPLSTNAFGVPLAVVNHPMAVYRLHVWGETSFPRQPTVNGAIPAAHTINIRNTGNRTVTNITIPAVGNWTITQPAATTLLPGQQTTFTLRPANTSPANTRHNTITVRGRQANGANVDGLTYAFFQVGNPVTIGTGNVNAVSIQSWGDTDFGTVLFFGSAPPAARNFNVRRRGGGGWIMPQVPSGAGFTWTNGGGTGTMTENALYTNWGVRPNANLGFGTHTALRRMRVDTVNSWPIHNVQRAIITVLPTTLDVPAPTLNVLGEDFITINPVTVANVPGGARIEYAIYSVGDDVVPNPVWRTTPLTFSGLAVNTDYRFIARVVTGAGAGMTTFGVSEPSAPMRTTGPANSFYTVRGASNDDGTFTARVYYTGLPTVVGTFGLIYDIGLFEIENFTTTDAIAVSALGFVNPNPAATGIQDFPERGIHTFSWITPDLQSGVGDGDLDHYGEDFHIATYTFRIIEGMYDDWGTNFAVRITDSSIRGFNWIVDGFGLYEYNLGLEEFWQFYWREVNVFPPNMPIPPFGSGLYFRPLPGGGFAEYRSFINRTGFFQGFPYPLDFDIGEIPLLHDIGFRAELEGGDPGFYFTVIDRITREPITNALVRIVLPDGTETQIPTDSRGEAVIVIRDNDGEVVTGRFGYGASAIGYYTYPNRDNPDATVVIDFDGTESVFRLIEMDERILPDLSWEVSNADLVRSSVIFEEPRGFIPGNPPSEETWFILPVPGQAFRFSVIADDHHTVYPTDVTVRVGGTWNPDANDGYGAFEGGQVRAVTFDEATNEFVVAGNLINGNVHIIANATRNTHPIELSWEITNGSMFGYADGWIDKYEIRPEWVARLPRPNTEYRFTLQDAPEHLFVRWPVVRVGGQWNPDANDGNGAFEGGNPIAITWDEENQEFVIAPHLVTGNIHITAEASLGLQLDGRIVKRQHEGVTSEGDLVAFITFTRHVAPGDEDLYFRRTITREAAGYRGYYSIFLPVATYDIFVTKRGYLNRTVQNMEVYEGRDPNIRDIEIIPGNSSWNGVLNSFLDIAAISGGWAATATPLARQRANISQNPGGRATVFDMGLAITNYGRRAVVEEYLE